MAILTCVWALASLITLTCIAHFVSLKCQEAYDLASFNHRLVRKVIAEDWMKVPYVDFAVTETREQGCPQTHPFALLDRLYEGKNVACDCTDLPRGFNNDQI